MSHPAAVRLSFKSPHLSITEFPDATLPNFSLLTGVNGVGKTHLLLAICSGRIGVEGITKGEILYFDWSTLYTLSSREVQRKDVRPSFYGLRKAIEEVRRAFRGRLAHAIGQHANLPHGNDPWVELRIHPELLVEQSVASVIKEASDTLDRHDGSPENSHALLFALDLFALDPQVRNLRSVLLLTDQEIELLPHTHSVGGQALQISDIGAVMMSYFELETHNKLCRIDAAEGRPPRMYPLTDEDFIKLNGPPPWEVMSEVLALLGLDFAVPGPQSYSDPAFTPRVIKKSTGQEITLESLSSGEKMLMALAVSTYASKTQNSHERNRAKLVLLDEIDAPLHPSMTRTMLSIIQETLIDRLGCSVILATHSPTTVAIAPEESIHVMRPDRPGVERLSREQAVRLLTAELPTLSLDFTGRRQVFVESAYDAQRYEALYQAFKDRLDSPFSLSFIGSGSKGGEEGGGCQAVQEVVNMLRKHGNRSVWGLIDWDSKNDGNKHVHVLAPGRRYSIENCLLDPLLVVALICDANSGVDRRKLGVRPGEGMGLLLAETAKTRRQELIIQVQRLILEERFAEAPSEEVAYGGGFSHEVSQAYLRFRGHDLTKRVLDAFKSLRKHRGEPELLLRAVHILEQHRGLMPLDLLKALQRLASPSPSDPALD